MNMPCLASSDHCILGGLSSPIKMNRINLCICTCLVLNAVHWYLWIGVKKRKKEVFFKNIQMHVDGSKENLFFYV